jgi:hypothetical protein
METVMVTSANNLISSDIEIGTKTRGTRFPLSKAKADHYRKEGLVLFDEDVKESKKAAPQSKETTKLTDPNAGGTAQQSTSSPAAPASAATTSKLSLEEKKALAAKKKAEALEKQKKPKKAQSK